MWKLLISLTLVTIFLPAFEQNDYIFNDNIDELTAYTNNVTTIQKPPSYYYLVNALKFIFLGPPKPANDTSKNIFDIIDEFDNKTDLNTMLIFVTQQYIAFLKRYYYEEEDYEVLLKDWEVILGILATEGSEKVTLGMLKPFINLLRPENLIHFWNRNGREIIRRNSKIKENFKLYIWTDFLDGVERPCKDYVAAWFQDIGNAKLWAITMLDAAAKPPSGLLNGNINWVGGYKECKNIKVKLESPNSTNQTNGGSDIDFMGKYCRASLKIPTEGLPAGLPIPQQIGMEIGICVPDVCSNIDAERIVNKSVQLLTLHEILPTKKVTCEYLEPYSNTFYAYSSICLFLILFVVLATIFDCIRRQTAPKPINKQPVNMDKVIEMKSEITGSNVIDPKKQHLIVFNDTEKKPSALVDFILNCSMYKNSERIFHTGNGGKFTSLNGLRALSMIWIIMGHTFNYIGDYTYFFTVPNIKELKDLEESPAAQLIINAMYGVDTFFLMSAFLLTYGFLKKLQKSHRLSAFEWFHYYVHRYWRLTPPYAIIIALYIYVIPWLGYGPLWSQAEFPIANEDCKDYWWSYLLMINNFVPDGKGTKCMGFLWYVCNDFQLYAISPIFLIMLYKFPIAGFITLSSVLVASLSVMGLLTANVYEINAREIIFTLKEIWGDIYIKPYCRAAPWIFGMFLGYFFYKKNEVKMNKALNVACWLISTCLALSTIFGGFTNHGKDWRRMETYEYALYFSLSRISWSLSISWIIFACHYGYGGIINRILSAKVFIPLAKISYCAYLIHPVIMVIYTFAQQGLMHATELTLIYLFFGHMVLTFILCFFYTLFFEQPFIALENFAMSGLKKRNHAE